MKFIMSIRISTISLVTFFFASVILILIPSYGLSRITNLESSTLLKRESGQSGSQSIWIVEDVYKGDTFFDSFDFFNGTDPTNGLVKYVDRDTAMGQHLAYTASNGAVIMRADNTTTLPLGQNRMSVRVQSQKTYTGGLFLLDLNSAPWGCAVWPAFWTLGPNWPQQGEIDILEGVHDNVHNQVTFHTTSGCNLTYPGNFTGTLVGQTDCNAEINNNAGCGVVDWSKVSYGETFDAAGGGIYAMKWDKTGIFVWYFYRVSIPRDILDGVPEPTTWTVPSAALSPSGCDPFEFFSDHQIVFDITLCAVVSDVTVGDWAGNSYTSTPGCTGTCPEHLTDPSNFVNASWSINSLTVYTEQTLSATVNSAAFPLFDQNRVALLLGFAAVLCILKL